MPQSKRKMPPLPAADEARLAPGAAELAESIAAADRATAAAARVARELEDADVEPRCALVPMPP